jgi:hypothetical protein
VRAIGRRRQVRPKSAAVHEGDLGAGRLQLRISDEISEVRLPRSVAVAQRWPRQPPHNALGDRLGSIDVARDKRVHLRIARKLRESQPHFDRTSGPGVSFALDDDVVGAAGDDPSLFGIDGQGYVAHQHAVPSGAGQ